METENTTEGFENIDIDSINIDFSFDDTKSFNGDTTKKEGFEEKVMSDYTQLFTTTRVFESKAELVEYCRSIGKQVNMSLTLCTNRQNKCTEVVVFYIFCERSGNYRPRNFKNKREWCTKKCQCPFKLKATGTRDGKWHYVVIEGRHNHHLPIYPQGHTIGKFTEAEYKLTSELTNSFMPPNDVFMTLQNVIDGNCSTIKHVNNARQKLRAEEMDGRRPIQQFQKLLRENGYYQFLRKVGGTNILSDICFVHPVSYKMLNAWPYVIALDCTYRTNKYELPLLEVVGFSPTWLTFTVAYCFLSSEKENTFVWALKNLRSFFSSEIPTAIVTDRELGLINAVGLIFPESKHMLCRRHIEMAIKSKAMKLSGGLESFAKTFVFKWNDAISSYIEAEWDSKWKKMEEEYVRYPKLLAYVKDTWILPYKKKIVSVCVDQYMHFGTYTTNRVESEHHRVKREVKSHVATFDTIFKRLNKVMSLQIEQIKASLAKSRTNKMIGFPSLFDGISCQVSHKALKLMRKEVQRNDATVHGMEAKCGCYVQRTQGLPCAYKLREYGIFQEKVPLKAIHPFWKKLDIETNGEPVDYDDDTYDKVWNDLLVATLLVRRRLFQNLREGLYAGSADIRNPDIIPSKGRPRKKQNARNPSEFEYAEKRYSTPPVKKGKSRSCPRSTYIASIQGKTHVSSPKKPPKSPVVDTK